MERGRGLVTQQCQQLGTIRQNGHRAIDGWGAVPRKETFNGLCNETGTDVNDGLDTGRRGVEGLKQEPYRMLGVWFRLRPTRQIGLT